MAHDVFISYSSKDKAVADAAVAALEAGGVRCWVAPRDIVPGTVWGRAIIQGINQSRAMVLVFSADSNASQQVLREVERAVNRGMPVVPFRIDNLLPSEDMEYFISSSHWLDAYTPPPEQHLGVLVEKVKVLLGDPLLVPPTPLLPVPVRRFRYLVPVVVIAGLLLAVGLAIRFLLTPPPTPTAPSAGVRSLGVGESHVFTGHTDAVNSVAFCLGGGYAVSAGRDRTVRLWNLDTGKQEHLFEGHTDSVLSVAASPDGRRALSCGADGTVRFWDLETRKHLRTIVAHEGKGKVYEVAFTPDGRQAVSCGESKEMRVWELDTGTEVKKLTGDYWTVFSVAVSPDGHRVLSGGPGLELWDFHTGETIWRYEINIFLWDPQPKDPPWADDEFSGPVTGAAFSADGRYVVCAAGRGRLLQVWSANPHVLRDARRAQGAVLGAIADRRGPEPLELVKRVWSEVNLRSVVFSPDGRRLLTAGESSDVILWDAATLRELRTLTGHSNHVWQVVVSADGTRALSASWDKTVRLWRLPE